MGWKEVGTRAQGSDMFVEEDRGLIMELASPSGMLFTVRWQVAASEQKTGNNCNQPRRCLNLKH